MASPAAPAAARGLGASAPAAIEGPAGAGAPAPDIADAADIARRDIAGLRPAMLEERARADLYLRAPFLAWCDRLSMAEAASPRATLRALARAPTEAWLAHEPFRHRCVIPRTAPIAQPAPPPA
eukprot:4507058-Pleurochrysis_carterae.AAC.1